ncbi:MAG: hypothetical protein H6730_11120 [Deltaproteobacteria bacterium]|nr:hypothetical protein [Deltaproteobacteria bacterium]
MTTPHAPTRNLPTGARALPALILCWGLAVPLAGCGRDGVNLGDGGASEDSGLLGDADPNFDSGLIDSGFDGGFPPIDAGPDGGVPDVGIPDTGIRDTGFPDTGFPDTGIPDTGFPDTGFPDTGIPDTGIRDTGFPDTGIPDTGLPDTGFPDGSLPDTGVPDTGVPDSGFPDGSLPDTGVPDTGFPDSGFPDGGFPDGGIPDSGVACPAGCGFLDDDCNVGVCAPDGITCVRAPRPSGTLCEDGNPCTLGDRCRLGTCLSGPPLDCSGTGDQCNAGVCDPTTGTCSTAQVPDGTPCEDNLPCTDSICVGGACVSLPQPPPMGDTCADPIPVAITPGSQVQSGDTTCAQNDLSGQCGGGGAPDIIFDATAGETRRLRIETIGPGTIYDTVLYVNDAQCAMPTAQVCDDDSGQVFFSLIDQVFTPGARFVVVDGFGASRGPFDLLIETDPHDTCANPSVLPIPPVGSSIEVIGNTSGNANDFQASCAGSANSPDQVWTFTVNQPTVLRFETLVPNFGNRYDTALHIRTACVPGNVGVIACDDDSGEFTLSRIERTFDPGTYFLMVDGFSNNSQGEYRLQVTQPTPTTPVIFPATGDARQPLVGPFTTAGEFVEGIRDLMLNSVSRMDVNVQVLNSLMCSAASFRVRVNNTEVGTFLVQPGDTTVSQSFTFPPITSTTGRYNIRYELRFSVQPSCGFVELPDDISTVSVGP